MTTLTRPGAVGDRPPACPPVRGGPSPLPGSAQPIEAVDLPRVLARLARDARRELRSFYLEQRDVPGAVIRAVVQVQLRRGVQTSVVCTGRGG